MNILEEANKITSGQRRKDYGHPKENCTKIAKIYNAITGQSLTAEDVVYVMIALKLARQQNKHKRDNLTDLAGYAWVLNEVIENSSSPNKHAMIDKMCSKCKGYATIIDSQRGLKLCQDCYDKL